MKVATNWWRQRRRTATCIALYGTPGLAGDLREWAGVVQQIAAERGCKIDLLGGAGRSRMVNIRELERSDLSAGEGVTLKASDGPKAGFFDWQLEAVLAPHAGYQYLCIEETYLPFDIAAILDVISRLLPTYACRYGFAYQHGLMGSSLYAVGMATNESTKAEKAELRSWWLAMTRGENSGEEPLWSRRIRDVYRCNLLSDAHLAMPIGSGSLRQWIERGPDRGVVRRLTEDHSVWTLTEAERRGVRGSGALAGIMINL